jgi:hypothetical protein
MSWFMKVMIDGKVLINWLHFQNKRISVDLMHLITQNNILKNCKMILIIFIEKKVHAHSFAIYKKAMVLGNIFGNINEFFFHFFLSSDSFYLH